VKGEAGLEEAFAALIESIVRRVLDERLDKPEPYLMTRDEAAKYLRVSTRQIDLLRAKGLPTRWVGDSPRFARAELDEWSRRPRKR
jgi:excisionase family DNA binding protein